LADLFNTSIGVISLSLLTICSDVSICFWVISTIASIISGAAIDQLLLRKSLERAGSLAICGFYGLRSGKGPARSTVSLVLHGSDTSTGSPVNNGSVGDRWGVLEHNVFRWACTFASASLNAGFTSSVSAADVLAFLIALGSLLLSCFVEGQHALVLMLVPC
jgi:hypothetical protein